MNLRSLFGLRAKSRPEPPPPRRANDSLTSIDFDAASAFDQPSVAETDEISEAIPAATASKQAAPIDAQLDSRSPRREDPTSPSPAVLSTACQKEKLEKSVVLHQEHVPREDRVQAEIEVRLYINSRIHDNDSHTANVSEHGMFVVTSRPLPVGTTTRFEMCLPGGSEISGFAEVAWIRPHFESPSRPSGMGVRYLAVRGDGQDLLREFVVDSLSISTNARVTLREQPL